MLNWVKNNCCEAVILAAFTAMMLLGFYMDLYEVDQKPTPRAIFNLGGAYFADGDRKMAITLWEMTAKYNETYGTDYKPGEKPHGRVIEMAKENLAMLKTRELIEKHFPDPTKIFNRGKD